MDLHISQCKIETKITRCYLVECVIKDTNTYYKSELVFTNRNDAKATCLFSENDLQSCMGIADYLITDVSGITKIWAQTDKPFEILE